MVGGLILMGVLVSFFAVGQAMILHGLIQLVSNGYRAFLNRHAINWRLMFGFVSGGFGAFGIMTIINFTPDRVFVFFALGALPFIAYMLPTNGVLNITRPIMPFFAGFAVVSVNLLTGVGGPILDVFFQRVPLTRHQVIANKAILQSFGHIIKIVFYIQLAITLSNATTHTDTSSSPALFTLPTLYLLTLAIIASVLGTRLGKRILDKMEDRQFFRLTQITLFGAGIVLILRGAGLILAESN